MRKTLYIIRGLSGSGKTTLARLLTDCAGTVLTTSSMRRAGESISLTLVCLSRHTASAKTELIATWSEGSPLSQWLTPSHSDGRLTPILRWLTDTGIPCRSLSASHRLEAFTTCLKKLLIGWLIAGNQSHDGAETV